VVERTTSGLSAEAQETPSGAVIRPARRQDLPALGRLGALLVQEHHEFDPRRFIPATERTASGYAAWLGSQLEEPGVIVLVAERNGQVLGYAYGGVEGPDYMSLRGPAGVLYDIIVDPDHRRGGLGRMLLDSVIEALEAQGPPRVVLSTAAQNLPAQRLFERAGFRRTMIEMTR
jgi:ribosomal protein S18 acetylase RimI-like enzyme